MSTGASDLRQQAAILRRCALAAPVALETVRNRARDELWMGPAAEQFSDELAARLASVRAAADEMERVAADLDRQATVLDEQAPD